MIPREKKSIFHLAGEGASEGINMTINKINSSSVNVESPVGLRILIHHHRTNQGTNVVIKPTMRSSTKAAAVRTQLSTCFLKFCFLCNRELSLQKDVYMYRGDQGFCSVECRHKQMAIDERREHEASARDRAGVTRHRAAIGNKTRETQRRRRISTAA